MKKIFSFVFTVYAFLVFIIVMFILFPFVIVATFFGAIKGGNIIYNICRLWADIFLFCCGIRHKNFYEESKNNGKAVVYVFNHISYIDIPLLLKTFRNEAIRVLGKAELINIPVFGFIYKNTAVSVQRDNAEARAKSVMRLKAIIKKNISIVISPEGTFNTTGKPLKEFYDGAFKIAIETQTDIQPVVFLDTYDRLNYKSIFSLTPGKSRALFLPIISVENYSLTELDKLKQKTYNSMEATLIEHNASWIK